MWEKRVFIHENKGLIKVGEREKVGNRYPRRSIITYL